MFKKLMAVCAAVFASVQLASAEITSALIEIPAEAIAQMRYDYLDAAKVLLALGVLAFGVRWVLRFFKR